MSQKKKNYTTVYKKYCNTKKASGVRKPVHNKIPGIFPEPGFRKQR